MYWADNPNPWRHQCRDGMPPVEDADVIAREEAAKKAAESDNAGSVSSGAHGERLRGFGVRVAWLLAFTFAHKCWDLPTWRVVRDIIKPATEARGRRRFAELDEVAPHTGPATVFMSHCWGAEWGGLVMAACAGARCDRVVWIDLFAVRAHAPRESREGGGNGAAPADYISTTDKRVTKTKEGVVGRFAAVGHSLGTALAWVRVGLHAGGTRHMSLSATNVQTSSRHRCTLDRYQQMCSRKRT